MDEITHDYTGQVLASIFFQLLLYAVGLFIVYFIIRAAVASGVKAANEHQVRQAAIANRLLAEQLKAEGVPAEKVDKILYDFKDQD